MYDDGKAFDGGRSLLLRTDAIKDNELVFDLLNKSVLESVYAI